MTKVVGSSQAGQMSCKRRLRGSTSAGPTPSEAPSSARAPSAIVMLGVALPAAPGTGVAGCGRTGGAATGLAGAACGRRCAAATDVCGGAGAGQPRGDDDGDAEEEEEDGEDGASCSAGIPSMSSASTASPAAGIVRMRANMAAAGDLSASA